MRLVQFIVVAALLGFAGRAHGICQPIAHYIYVGDGAHCDETNIQTAINNATCPGTNIVVTTQGTNPYWLSFVHATINKSVTIVGSTVACGSPPPVCDPSAGCGGAPTKIAVNGDGAGAVFYVTTNGAVAFKNLDISGGYGFGQPLEGGGGIRIFGSATRVSIGNVELHDNRGSTEGGGVAFFGDGSLTLDGVSVHDNSALSYGGGISAISSDTGHIDVTIADNPVIATDIYNNHVTRDGGGLYVDGNTHLVAVTANARIHDNQASENGGGILIGDGVVADIGLQGNAIDHNVAGSGGGISISPRAKSSIARLFSVVGAQPFTLHDNLATTFASPEYSGGGLHLRQGYSHSASTRATACLFDIDMIDNSAVDDGTAIAVEEYGRLLINPVGDSECDGATVAALGAVPSAFGGSRFIFNFGLNSSSPSGVIDAVGASTTVQARRFRMEKNNGYAIRTQNAAGGIFSFSECLIDNNVASNELVTLQGASASFDGCTFADDSIGGTNVFAFDTGLSVTRSILAEATNVYPWQPTAPALTAQYLLLSGPKVPIDSTVKYASPGFVDPANGDYHLQTISPAVDYAPAGNGTVSIDLDGYPRAADLPEVTNRFGARDLGAYEVPLPDEIFKNGFQ